LKIWGFLKLSTQQKSDLKQKLDQMWDGGWQHPVPELIPGKLWHGYEGRVLKDGFSLDQFIDWIRVAGGDPAIVTLK